MLHIAALLFCSAAAGQDSLRRVQLTREGADMHIEAFIAPSLYEPMSAALTTANTGEPGGGLQHNTVLFVHENGGAVYSQVRNGADPITWLRAGYVNERSEKLVELVFEYDGEHAFERERAAFEGAVRRVLIERGYKPVAGANSDEEYCHKPRIVTRDGANVLHLQGDSRALRFVLETVKTDPALAGSPCDEPVIEKGAVVDTVCYLLVSVPRITNDWEGASLPCAPRAELVTIVKHSSGIGVYFRNERVAAQ